MKHYLAIISLIENLINEHDCIIIPNFGGFVVNMEDFKLSDDQQKIYPRRRWIAFNERLKSDDGLLSIQWASQQSISHKEAFKEINQFGQFIKSELAKNQILKLGSIGEFYLNPESNLLFTPNTAFNYDLTVFGLGEVSLTDIGASVKNKEKPVLIEPIIESEIREEKTTEEIESNKINQKTILPKHIVYTVLAFLFAGFSAYYLTEPNSRYANSSFSPFTIKIAKSNKSISIPKKENKVTTAINEPATDSSQIHSNETAETIKQTDKIYLIAASFLTKEKAEVAMNQLKEQGFLATEILAKNEHEKFYRVSLGNKESFEAAYKDAAKLKKENKLDIWVYKP